MIVDGAVLIAAERQFAAALLAAALGEAGYHVHWTTSLRDARELATTTAFSAILADLSQPSTETLRELDKLAEQPDAPALIAIAPDSRMVLPASVAFVVHRPFNGTQLIETVQAAVTSADTSDWA